jgi:hypothetical protein
MNFNELAITCVIGVIAFFLRDLFKRLTELEEKADKYQAEFGKMIGRISNIDTKATAELKRIEEMMNIHFKNQSDKLEELQRLVERINQNK